MNDLDLLAFALAEETLRRKRLELENAQLRKKLTEREGAAGDASGKTAES